MQCQFTGRFRQWKTWQQYDLYDGLAVDTLHQHDTSDVNCAFPSQPTFAPSCVDYVGSSPAETYMYTTLPQCHINWQRRLSNPDLSEVTLHFWSRAATTGSDTSPLRTTPGCGYSCRWLTGHQAGVEAPARMTLLNVGAADRGRHWAQRQRRLEDRTWQQVLEGAMTRGWSSVPLTDWLTY